MWRRRLASAVVVVTLDDADVVTTTLRLLDVVDMVMLDLIAAAVEMRCPVASVVAMLSLLAVGG